jgi:hypothetical protein
VETVKVGQVWMCPNKNARITIRGTTAKPDGTVYRARVHLSTYAYQKAPTDYGEKEDVLCTTGSVWHVGGWSFSRLVYDPSWP